MEWKPNAVEEESYAGGVHVPAQGHPAIPALQNPHKLTIEMTGWPQERESNVVSSQAILSEKGSVSGYNDSECCETFHNPASPELTAIPRIQTPLNRVISHLDHYSAIDLEELKNSDADLLNRKEMKFLMTFDQCVELIDVLSGSYRVLEIEGSRVGKYETLYYDTPTFTSYMEHHNGKGNRFKLRFRLYCSTGKTFLEIKKKLNTGRTQKIRQETKGPVSLSDEAPASFIHSALGGAGREFLPVLTTGYYRVTMVSETRPERITFDLFLTFSGKDTTCSYPSVVVGEIKYNSFHLISEALLSLKSMGIRKVKFSKYCIGVSCLYRDLKHNTFKPALLQLCFLSGGGNPS